MDEATLEWARTIWNYHQLGQPVFPGDVIVALGTNDLRVAEFAADLYLRGSAPWLLCSGGVAHAGDLLATTWDKTEAEIYAEVAGSKGVARDRILLETRATNTAENLRFSRELLESRGLRPKRILIAVKPFMQRRVWATLPIAWPAMPASIVSPAMTLDEYFTAELTPEKIINIMLGDLQRIWVYARRGWSTPQPLPAEVTEAYAQLVQRGFTRHLIAED